jgi:hypothetical protein
MNNKLLNKHLACASSGLCTLHRTSLLLGTGAQRGQGGGGRGKGLQRRIASTVVRQEGADRVGASGEESGAGWGLAND